MNQNKAIAYAAALLMAGGSFKIVASQCWGEVITACPSSVPFGCSNYGEGGSVFRNDMHVYSYATDLEQGVDVGWDSPGDFIYTSSPSVPCISYHSTFYSGRGCTGTVTGTGGGTFNNDIGRYTSNTDPQCKGG